MEAIRSSENFGWLSTDYMALYPRRQYCLNITVLLKYHEVLEGKYSSAILLITWTVLGVNLSLRSIIPDLWHKPYDGLWILHFKGGRFKSFIYSKIWRKIKETPCLIQVTHYNAVPFQTAMKFFVEIKDNMQNEIFYRTRELIIF
jgi:hypothetical protein